MPPSNPDWDRYRVVSPASTTGAAITSPLGDPTTWGGQLNFQIPALVAGAATGLVSAGQVLRTDCKDLYTRPWALLGQIDIGNGLGADPWSQGSPYGAAPGPDLFWDVWMVLRMGAGRSTIVHRLSLRQMVALTMPGAGGAPTADQLYFLPPGDFGYPFVMSGGILGKSVSMEILYSFAAAGGGAGWPDAMNCNVKASINPYAPGGGL